MTDEPMISIITVVYNGANTIEQTIQSVLAQSYKKIEYIIIDGASTDNTQKIVENYRDAITHFISEKDNGIYDAINKGLRLAQGDIVGIINSDDWYELDAFASVVEVFTNFPEIDIVYGDINYVDVNGNKEKHNQAPFNHIWYEMSIPHPTAFVKRSVYEEYGVFDDSYQIAADYELMYRLYHNKCRFAHIGKVIANFRVSGISNTQHSDCVKETKRVADQYFDWDLFVKKCSDRFVPLYAPLYVFGAGEWGNKVISAFQRKQITVFHCLDNNGSKWGSKVQGIYISSPGILKDEPGQIMIALAKGEEDVVKQLESMELNNCSWVKLSDCLKEYELALIERCGMCLEV